MSAAIGTIHKLQIFLYLQDTVCHKTIEMKILENHFHTILCLLVLFFVSDIIKSLEKK